MSSLERVAYEGAAFPGYLMIVNLPPPKEQIAIQVQELLCVIDLPSVEIFRQTGFTHSNHPLRIFRAVHNINPKQWRELYQKNNHTKFGHIDKPKKSRLHKRQISETDACLSKSHLVPNG
jgi:hypothetical protein